GIRIERFCLALGAGADRQGDPAVHVTLVAPLPEIDLFHAPGHRSFPTEIAGSETLGHGLPPPVPAPAARLTEIFPGECELVHKGGNGPASIAKIVRSRAGDRRLQKEHIANREQMVYSACYLVGSGSFVVGLPIPGDKEWVDGHRCATSRRRFLYG